jgi:hypothetical protein
VSTCSYQLLLGAAILFCARVTEAAPPPSGVAPLIVPAGGFGIDGDLMANTPTANVGDWLISTNAGTGGAVLNAAGVALNGATTFHIVDQYNSTSDDTFSGGLKWGDDPNTWTWTTGKAPSKTDINNVLIHLGTDTNGHSWVVIAGDRLSTSGDSYIDFELLQNTLTENTNGTFTSAGPNGGRTTNDLLLSLAFTGGGNVVDFFVLRWLTNSAGGGFTYIDSTASLPAGRVFAALNSNTVAVPFKAFGLTTYAANSFGEAAVDLTSLLGSFDQCASVGFRTIMVKTKASASSSATIEDFVPPLQYNFKVGPSANAGPAQAQCTQGDSTAFPLHGSATAGVQPIASTTWSVVSGTATIDDVNSLTTTAHVFTASATLQLTVIESTGCAETNDVVLSVLPFPGCSITGPSMVCPALAAQFQAPIGMNAYAWSITGNGSITGATNGQTVTVTAGTACGTDFTLSLLVTSNGCASACSTDVLVSNAIAPSLSCPADVTLECPANTTTNNTGVATAQGVCGHVTVTYSDSVSNVCGGAKVIFRTWTATDLCGNTTNCTQTITIRDTTAPRITCPTNMTLQCPANTSTNVTGVATATDTCSSVSISYSDSVSNTCGGAYVISRLWTAADACGNSASCVQTITVRDTTAPTMTCPGNVVLECPADISTNNTGTATATDTCSAVTITYSDSVSNTCGGSKIISRTWTATDGCSNRVSCVQTITVRDTTAPTITCPSDMTLECPANTSTNNTGVATATDACSSVSIGYSDSVSNTCGGSRIISRTWTATDACGNHASCVQKITVQDTTPPTITCPSNLVLECPATTTTNVTGVATATDTCSSVSISYSDSVSNVCGGAKVISRTWTAIDACGNRASCVQTITVQDTTAPRITCPTNVTLQCPANTSTNATGAATATDTCSSVSISYTDSVSNTCGGAYVISRLWTATDACGNSASCIQTITVRDTTAPTITCPSNVVLECPADISTNNTGTATATDSCSSVTISYSDSVSNTCGGSRIISRTWTATDSCGNHVSCIQTITVRDTTAPTITCPPDVTLECPANTSTNNTGVATAVDTCSSVSISYSDSVSNTCGGSKIIFRTWTAIDGCSNRASCVQRITVQDTTPPTITCPSNLVLECPANTTTNATGVATATDTCSSVSISYSDSVSNICGGAKVISRIWTAIDACGNHASCVQTITVQDTTPPRITCPTNVTLECPANITTNNTGVATATDTCSSVSISYSDSVSNICGGAKVISRTWTATDACGNSASCVQTITVRDTTAPTITCPSNVVLECPANTGTNATGMATATDACSSVSISYSDSVTNTCGGSKIISRTWTATDACGNHASCVQTITVRDTTPPTITCPPNLVLECPANTTTNNTGVATAQDGCSVVTISYSDSVSNICGGAKVIFRTWTAIDACGNRASCVQTITVRDTTPPSITCPTNVVLECPASNTGTNFTGVATAQDTCSAFTLSYSDVVSNGCGGSRTIYRTWTAVDACGNTSNCVQTISIRDRTPPVINCPSNVVLECPANTTTNATGVATASDTCSSVSISYSDSISNVCGGAKVIFRSWTATDACGNAASCVQTITLRDTTSPTITRPPDVAIECGTSTLPSATGAATATDTCSAVTVTYSDVVSNNCGGSRVIYRTWTAADGCGNSVTALQTITVRDTTPPSLRLPANLTLQCPGDTRTIVTGVPVVTDGCSSFSVSYSDVVSNSCGATKTVWRTWTAIDACGNSTNGLQIISVIDTKPSISCPSVSVQCVGDIPPAYADLSSFLAAGGTATDSCSAVTFSQTSDSGLVGRCPGTVTRVYRVTDACGNYSECTQTITVDDTIPPVLTCPTNASVECGVALIPANTGTATATDNCSTNVTLTYADSPPIPSCYNLAFYAADPGVTNNATYLRLSPVSLPCPASALTTGRAADPLRNAIAYGPTASQFDAVTSLAGDTFCLGQIVPFEFVINVCGGVGPERGTIDISATWATYTTSNDRFGFDTNYMVYCAFVDTADAGYYDPANSAHLVSYKSTLLNQGTISEEILGTFTVGGLQPGARVIMEVWLVLDSSMPSHAGGDVAAQMVSAQADSVPPVSISTTGSKTISISANKITPLPPPQPQPPPIPPTQQPPAPPGAIVNMFNRTWTATDDCGNSSTCVQQITVRDSTPPVLTLPSDIVLQCPADTSTNSTGTATAQDACGASYLTYSDNVTNGCGGSEVISRLWIATDQAGNTTNAVQTITVSTAPVITCPPNLVLECPASTATNFTGVATAQPGCSSVAAVSYSDSVSNTCGGSYVLSRTWTATDVCGNSASCVQTITVRDTTPPTISCPSNLVLECSAPTTTNFTGVATARDTCSSVAVSYSDSVSNICGGSRVISRVWTATDACGNQAGCVQTITLRDTTPPILVCPSNLVLECPANTTTNYTGVATAHDGCSSVTLTYSDSVSNTCGAAKVISRTWIATDGCGNSSSCVQTITVRDSTPPTITCATNRTVSTGTAWTFDAPTATDGCGTVTIQVMNTVTNRPSTNTLVATRTWQATDSCGNTNTCQQSITVLSGTPPTISGQPSGTTIALGGSTSLSVVAGGSGLTYQWSCNGTNLSGATGSTLNLNGLQFTNSGLYSVTVSNAGGAITSQAAVVNVLPILAWQRITNNLVLTWPAPFLLQSATNVTGPYSDVVAAFSPWSPTFNRPRAFFRLRSPTVNLVPTNHLPGQFSLTCQGIPGCVFVIQASTNLSTWVNLQTNCSPFTFTDTNAAQYPRRFYRAAVAH